MTTTAYCFLRWQLYSAYCKASAAHYHDPIAENYAALCLAREALQDHRRTCADCKAHAREMVRLARDAWQPEYTEDNDAA